MPVQPSKLVGKRPIHGVECRPIHGVDVLQQLLSLVPSFSSWGWRLEVPSKILKDGNSQINPSTITRWGWKWIKKKCSETAFPVLFLKAVQACPSIILKTRGISIAILVKCDVPFILRDHAQRFILEMCWEMLEADNRCRLVNACQVTRCRTSCCRCASCRCLSFPLNIFCRSAWFVTCWDMSEDFKCWVSSILLIIENLALVTMEQLQPCLITMNFMHIMRIIHHCPNAWTNATQIHPPYLLLERALPLRGALVTPSEVGRCFTIFLLSKKMVLTSYHIETGREDGGFHVLEWIKALTIHSVHKWASLQHWQDWE